VRKLRLDADKHKADVRHLQDDRQAGSALPMLEVDYQELQHARHSVQALAAELEEERTLRASLDEELRVMKKHLGSQIKQLEGKANSHVEEIRDAYEAMSAENSQLRGHVTALELALDEARAERMERSAEPEQLEEAVRFMTIELNKEQRATLELEAHHHRTVEALQAELDQYRNSLELTADARRQHELQQTAEVAENERLQQQLLAQQAELESLRNDLRGRTKSVQSKDAKLRAAESKALALERELAQLHEECAAEHAKASELKSKLRSTGKDKAQVGRGPPSPQCCTPMILYV
jgi:chromosome segregation ATPase